MMADTPIQAPLPFEGPPPPEKPPAAPGAELWSWTDLVLFLGLAFVAFLVASFCIAFGLAALRTAGFWRVTSQQAENDPLVSLAVESAFYIMVVAIIYTLVVVYHRQPFWASLQWRRPSLGAIVGYLAGGLMMAVGAQLVLNLVPDKQDFPLERMLSTPLGAYMLGAFAVLVAPFMEELIFRGVIFSVLERRVSVLFAAVTTAALFGALHIQEYSGAWTHVILIFGVGAVFSLTRAWTRSITPGVILHIGYNLTTMIGIFIQTQHFSQFGAL